MAHAINELAEGIHSFATAREHAWHRLGTVVEDSFDARTALDAAHLAGWNVRKAPVFMLDENGNTLDVDRKFATFYTNPITGENQALGVVGSYYEPIQNEQHVELLDAIVDQSGAHFETAGSLYGGRQVFISMKMPNTIHVGGKDPVDLYLVAMNSHDGSLPFRFMVTPIRVVCANTLAAAFRAAQSTFSVRHTRAATGVIAAARDTLEISFKYFDEFQREAEAMINATYAEDNLRALANTLFSADSAKTDRQGRNVEEHVNNVIALFRDSATITDIKGTRWGAYQAFTEYADHFMNVRQKGNSPEKQTRAMRAVLAQPVVTLKERAFAALAV
jgi:phage/plasmid-like protein (TIGR03299 family)